MPVAVTDVAVPGLAGGEAKVPAMPRTRDIAQRREMRSFLKATNRELCFRSPRASLPVELSAVIAHAALLYRHLAKRDGRPAIAAQVAALRVAMGDVLLEQANAADAPAYLRHRLYSEKAMATRALAADPKRGATRTLAGAAQHDASPRLPTDSKRGVTPAGHSGRLLSAGGDDTTAARRTTSRTADPAIGGCTPAGTAGNAPDVPTPDRTPDSQTGVTPSTAGVPSTADLEATTGRVDGSRAAGAFDFKALMAGLALD